LGRSIQTGIFEQLGPAEECKMRAQAERVDMRRVGRENSLPTPLAASRSAHTRRLLPAATNPG